MVSVGGPTGQGPVAVVAGALDEVIYVTCFMSAVAVPYCGRPAGR
jgi:hypothetical protein